MSSPSISKSILVICSSINLIGIAIIAWACFHGLDLSDESYYILGYKYFDGPLANSGSSFHMVYHQLFGFLNLDYVSIRLFRLALSLLAGIVLFFGVKKIISTSSSLDGYVLFNVIISGILLSYSWSPLALSYNSMSYILIYLIFSLWIQVITSDKKVTIIIASILIGTFSCLLFFVKITNVGIIFILLLLSFSLKNFASTSEKIKLKNLWVLAPLSIVGILGTLLVLSKGNSEVGTLVSEHIERTFAISQDNSGHSLRALLDRYYSDFESVFKRVWLPVSTLFVLLAILKQRNIKSYLELIFGSSQKAFDLLTFIAIGIFIVSSTNWIAELSSKYKIIDVYLILFFASFFRTILERIQVNFFLILSILALAITGAFGTNNGLSAQVLLYGGFLFLAIYLIQDQSLNLRFKYASSLLMIGLCSFQIIYASVIIPYRQAPLKHARYKLDNNNMLKGLSVDKNSLNLNNNLNWIKEAPEEFVFTFAHQKGIALLVEKTPFTLAWISESSASRICQTFHNTEVKPQNVLFLIPLEIELDSVSLNCMKSSGFDIESNFIQVQQVEYYDYAKKKELTLGVFRFKQNDSL